MKDKIIFALYKDKPIKNRHKFMIEIEKYKNEINARELYTKIVNYQIDKYGGVLDEQAQTSNYVERMCINGNWSRKEKCREYRKGNRI